MYLNNFEMRLLNLRINFYFCGRFVLISVVFVLFLLSLRFGQISPQDSAFLSEVAVNHLKKARGEIWPKPSERRNNTKSTEMRTKSPQ